MPFGFPLPLTDAWSGLDWDSTFEGELLQRTSHCKVYGYDFTARGFGHGVPRALKGRTHFARLGLGAVDSHGPADEPKMWTLRSLMAANGHDHIDVLHIDIEGWEFEVLRAMVVDFAGIGSVAPGAGVAGEAEVQERGVLPFGQLLIEFHVWHEKFEQFLAFWEMLENVGLRPFMSEVRLSRTSRALNIHSRNSTSPAGQPRLRELQPPERRRARAVLLPQHPRRQRLHLRQAPHGPRDAR